jgi:S-adenosylmethionine synthetase
LQHIQHTNEESQAVTAGSAASPFGASRVISTVATISGILLIGVACFSIAIASASAIVAQVFGSQVEQLSKALGLG